MLPPTSPPPLLQATRYQQEWLGARNASALLGNIYSCLAQQLQTVGAFGEGMGCRGWQAGGSVLGTGLGGT